MGPPLLPFTGELVRIPVGGRIGRPSGLVWNVSDEDAEGQAPVPREYLSLDPLGKIPVTLRELRARLAAQPSMKSALIT